MRIVFVSLILSGLAVAQHLSTIESGAELFARNCSACHGDTAKGGRGPDLTTGQWKHGSTDAEIIRNFVQGIPGTQMPAIAVSAEDAKLILAFLRDVNGAGGQAKLRGDLASGRTAFFGAGKCSECHNLWRPGPHSGS
jgi:mono/diheme cytochrome c family protein